jgi:HAE1 family hydrophobic/amphiphilic exporter-1
LEASFSGVRNRTTSFFSSLVPSISAQFDVQFRQSLLQGFGRVGQEYQIEISRKNLEISKQEFKRRVTEVVYRVQDRYWELVYSLKDIQVKEKSLQLARTVLEQNRARLAVGTAARLEVVQAEAEAALREEELVRSRYAFRLVQDQLIQLIADYEDPREFPGQIVPSDPVRKPPQVEEPFEALQARALQTRPELEAAALEVATQEVNLKMTRNKLRPSLDLVAAYQQFGLGGNLVLRDFSQGFLDPPILGTQPGGLGGALDQMLTGGFYGYMLGLNLQLPIFNSEARTANAQALIARDRSAMRRRSIQQLVAVELRDALTQIEMNLARLQAADAAVISARERLVGEQARFEAGMATTRELIEAQRDLAAAESVQLRAQVDLVKSHALLDRAAGMTFDRHNIRLAEALAVNVRD